MAKEATTKDPMVEYVVGEFERYEQFHRERFDKAEKTYDHWANKPPKREYQWMNAVHVPVTVEGEQTITPKLFTALFPTDAPLEVKVEGDTPPEQGVRIKSILQHFFRVSNVQGECWPMLTQNTLFGTGYIEAGTWKVKRAWQHDEEGFRYNAIVENRPDCNFVSFFEMFPHPGKIHIDDGLPLIRRRFCDAEFLKNLFDNPGFDTANLKRALDSKMPNATGRVPQMQKKPWDEYEILEYWGPWDASYKDAKGVVTKKAIPYWIIVINREVMIRGIENPFNHQLPPFCKVKLFEDAKPCWFGVGIGQIGRPTQERLNKIVNQRLDNVDLVLNKERVYNGNDLLINTKKLGVSKPGQAHKVSDVNTSLKWNETPDVTKSSYEEEKLAKQDYREATGATAHLMPEAGSEHRTAMGIQMLQGTAGTRFRPVLRQLEIDFIQQIAMFFFANLKQFMTEDEWVIVTGKNGEQEPIRISPQDIQAKAFFIPTGVSETMAKEVQVGQLMRFKELTMNDPTVNRVEINKRIAELMGFKDMQELFVQQPPQPTGPAQPGELGQNERQLISQRLAEGASPDQIKREMLGPPPMPQPAGAGAQ
jgi:hypothetical protein